MRNIKFLIIFILTYFPLNIFAQDWFKSNFHEFRISIGSCLDYVTCDFDDDYYYDYNYKSSYHYNDLNIDHNICCDETFYYGDKYALPNINVSYGYQLRKWLFVSAILSYYHCYQKSYEFYTDDIYSKMRQNRIAIIPNVRIDWVRARRVRLYSSIGIGIGYEFKRKELKNTSVEKKAYNAILLLDEVCFGIAVGRKIFVFGEVGASTIGVFKAGLGYRLK